MPSLPSLFAFLVTVLVVIVIPGPSVLFIIGRSLSLGRKGGLLTVLGNSLGLIPQLLVVAFGLGLVLQASIVLLTVLKIAGGLYLIYLGVQAIRHRGDGVAAMAATPRSQTGPRLLAQAFLVGLTNPKTVVLFTAVLPQFIDARQPATPQLLLLGIVTIALGMVCDCVWAIAAGSARQWFARSSRRITRTSTAGGILMIGLGGTLMVSAVPGVKL